MDHFETVKMVVDYLFGKDVGSMLTRERMTFSFSMRTDKIRKIMVDGKLFGTFRSDGGIALTVFGAQVLSKHPNFKSNCVVVREDVVDFIARGLSVFAKHVVDCGDSIRPGSEVAVMNSKGDVIAVGRAILSAKMMKRFKTGVAIKVRSGTQKALREEHSETS